MIILDTNLVSEPLKPKPHTAVLAWLDRQVPETLYITSIALAELQAGIETLPLGKRRKSLQDAMTEIVAQFEGRVLPFDQDCAMAFGRVFADARSVGNAIHFGDCAIAAIAIQYGYALATRNVKDYKGTGIELINPWAVS